ncbi:hypothetical protein FDECE_15890 [Fusarium decemcellulare]|nr:hypothetical protein FDECE_15890 [Fusarium decemcellulare]
MSATLDRIGCILWKALRHVAVISPAGTLLGAAVALRLPRHIHHDVVVLLLLALSGAMSALVYTPAFREARIGRFAVVVAFVCVASRILTLKKSLSPTEEIMSCLRDYAVIMAVVVFVMVVARPDTATRTRQTEVIAAEKTDLLVARVKPPIGSELSTSRTWDLSSYAGTLDIPSDIGSIMFKYMPGPKSRLSGYSSSDESVLTLSSGSKRDPAWAMNIVQWATTAGQTTFGREGGSAHAGSAVEQEQSHELDLEL